MPRLIPFRPAAVCALALLLIISSATTASARKVTADLRVVAGGKTFAEESLATGTTKIRTSPKARCFGAGTQGSGKSKTVKGATALGLLAQAASSNSALRPFYVTDAFSFGLGVCTVGGKSGTSKLSWYLKVDHKGLAVSGDHAKLRAGDEVLWDLAPYPYPNELFITGPDTATAGLPFKVRVFSYDEKGMRKPVKGAKVTGAAGPTGADGTTTVTLTQEEEIRATHGKEIPSNALAVCVGICG
jgi:hypothetical protein